MRKSRKESRQFPGRERQSFNLSSEAEQHPDEDRLGGGHDRKGIDCKEQYFMLFFELCCRESFAGCSPESSGQCSVKEIAKTGARRVGDQIIDIRCTPTEHLEEFNQCRKQKTCQGNPAHTS